MLERNQRILELAAQDMTSQAIANQLITEQGVIWDLKATAVRKILERERRRVTTQRQISVTQRTYVAA